MHCQPNSFVQIATGMQSGAVFSGKFSMPTLALLGVVVMMFGANLEGIKKEIYGYGVNDVPSDEKCALVFDSIKKFNQTSSFRGIERSKNFKIDDSGPGPGSYNIPIVITGKPKQ